MITGRPPRVAIRLLQFFWADHTAEALVGDLIEQWHTGYSRAWFWHQTINAIGVCVMRDFRRHPWVAGRAVMFGWITYICSVYTAFALNGIIRGSAGDWLAANGYYSMDWFFWSSQMPLIASGYVMCAICGWLVARLHRQVPAALVLSATSVFALESRFAVWVLWQWSTNHDLSQILALRELGTLLLFVGRPIALIIGGGMGAQRSTPSLPSAA